MDETVEDIAIIAAFCSCAYYNYMYVYHKTKIKKPRKKRIWMKTIHRNRTKQTMEKQLSELFTEASGEFENFIHISRIDFEHLVNKVSPVISKQDTRLREAIPAKIRVAITLRYLVSGDSYKSLDNLFNVSSEAISKIVPEVCAALNDVLKDQIEMPSTAEEWLNVEKGFRDIFPRALGTIDGKYIVTLCPAHTELEYYNYKRTFNIVLLALVDSNYRFMFVDIGNQKRANDGDALENSFLWRNICDNNLHLPAPCPLPGSDVPVPYVFLGDGAFALTTYVMEPFSDQIHESGTPKQIFNEKLSLSRVKVENTFGVLASKFRIFKKPIPLHPKKATIVTMTCILLHNFLKNSSTSEQIYMSSGTVDCYDGNGILLQEGSWRRELDSTCAIRPFRQKLHRPEMNAIQIREEFTTYFCNNL